METPSPSAAETARRKSLASEREREKRGKDHAPGKKGRTRAELVAGAEGKGRPVDFVKPYYGDEFGAEVDKAEAYNKKTSEWMGSKENGFGVEAMPAEYYDRIFDTIERKSNNDEVPYYQRSPTEAPYVNVPKQGLVNERNMEFARKALAGDEEGRQKIEGLIRQNGFRDVEELNGDRYGQTLEHEMGHHFSMKEKNGSNFARDSSMGDGYDKYGKGDEGYHLVNDAEMNNALGIIQRQTYQATGKRYERPEEFMDMIIGGKIPNYLDEEGRRLIHTIHSVYDKDSKAGTGMMIEAAKRIPATVKNEQPSLEEQTRGMIRSYLASLG